jgi:hypothetical protein
LSFEIDGFFHASEGFQEGNLDLALQTGPTLRSHPLSGTSAKIEKLFKNGSSTSATSEYVPKHGEDILEGRKSSLISTLLETFMAKLVVNALFFRVVENFICFGGFLEVFRGLLVALIAIRMIFKSKLPVGTLQLFGCGILTHTQDFIVISLGHYRSLIFVLFCINAATA